MNGQLELWNLTCGGFYTHHGYMYWYGQYYGKPGTKNKTILNSIFNDLFIYLLYL